MGKDGEIALWTIGCGVEEEKGREGENNGKWTLRPRGHPHMDLHLPGWTFSFRHSNHVLKPQHLFRR